MLTEQHCHLSGLVTASDVVAICESWPVDASLAVVGGGAGILALARQGETVLAQRWCLKPVPPSSHRGWSGWQRFQAHAAVAGAHPGERPRRAQERLFAVSQTILQRQAARWCKEGVSSAEVRIHVGAAASNVQCAYVDHCFDVAEQLRQLVDLRIRLTLPRQGWQRVVERLVSALETHSDRWVGWDFSGHETQPAAAVACAQLPLAPAANLSVHAGEQLAGPRPYLDALRHCHEAVTLWGAQRLGHAAILGLSPQAWIGRAWQWSPADLSAASAWLDERLPPAHATACSAAGLLQPQGVVTAQASEALQVVLAWVIEELRESGVLIETCPTSNARIVASARLRHPLPGLLATRLPLVVGTDDPGLLGTSPRKEYARMQHFAKLACADR